MSEGFDSVEASSGTWSPDLSQIPQSKEGDITEAVVTATAEVTGLSPLEMDPLYTSVDPDALESLVGGAGDGAAVTISFDFNGCRVTVHPDGQIDVEER